MDWTSTWEGMGDQGPLFWMATVAVALGVALIVSAGVIHWRQLRARKKEGPVQSAESAPLTPPADPNPCENARAMGIPGETPGLGIWPESTCSNLYEPEWGLLAARLRAAADLLDDHWRQGGRRPASDSQSSLKESSDGVDYLFRAGKG